MGVGGGLLSVSESGILSNRNRNTFIPFLILKRQIYFFTQRKKSNRCFIFAHYSGHFFLSMSFLWGKILLKKQ